MKKYAFRLGLILGGARSGKSLYAEKLVTAAPGPWVYVATAQALDAEMKARIKEHARRRGDSWLTVEEPLELADAVASAGRMGRPVLVDCLTLWLSNLMLAGRSPEAETDRLLAALVDAAGPLVLVSNEVGLGLVPDNALGRAFRDAQGRLNQRTAALADHVVFMAAGLPLTLK
jgi:adenosylcobinamide kinase / adenosylcobinamide-phosphate guanylyltransferase